MSGHQVVVIGAGPSGVAAAVSLRDRGLHPLLMDRADEAKARALVVVDHDDKPIAIVNEAAVMATPEQRRPWIDAGSLARSIDPSLVLPADLSGMALLNAVRRSPASEYLLVETSGQICGVLAAADLDHAFAGA